MLSSLKQYFAEALRDIAPPQEVSPAVVDWNRRTGRGVHGALTASLALLQVRFEQSSALTRIEVELAPHFDKLSRRTSEPQVRTLWQSTSLVYYRTLPSIGLSQPTIQPAEAGQAAPLGATIRSIFYPRTRGGTADLRYNPIIRESRHEDFFARLNSVLELYWQGAFNMVNDKADFDFGEVEFRQGMPFLKGWSQEPIADSHGGLATVSKALKSLDTFVVSRVEAQLPK